MVDLRAIARVRKLLNALGIQYTERRLYGPASRGDFAHSTKVLTVSEQDYQKLQQATGGGK